MVFSSPVFLPKAGYKGLEPSLPTFDIGFGMLCRGDFFVCLFCSEIKVCKIKKMQFYTVLLPCKVDRMLPLKFA